MVRVLVFLLLLSSTVLPCETVTSALTAYGRNQPEASATVRKVAVTLSGKYKNFQILTVQTFDEKGRTLAVLTYKYCK